MLTPYAGLSSVATPTTLPVTGPLTSCAELSSVGTPVLLPDTALIITMIEQVKQLDEIYKMFLILFLFKIFCSTHLLFTTHIAILIPTAPKTIPTTAITTPIMIGITPLLLDSDFVLSPVI